MIVHAIIRALHVNKVDILMFASIVPNFVIVIEFLPRLEIHLYLILIILLYTYF